MQFKDHPLRLLHRNIEIKFHLRYFSHISAASSFSSARITFPWPLILIFFFFNLTYISFLSVKCSPAPLNRQSWDSALDLGWG